MCFEVLFFDLDDTLYPKDSGLWQAIRQRIDQYLVEKMNLPKEIVSDLRKELFQKYGTTLRGLEQMFQVDEQDFLNYVHDLPLADYLQPDPKLRQTLGEYPQRKVIFTNADTNHANRVISTLGLDGCFDQIIDIRDIHPYCKPQPEAFDKALELANVKNPQECVMIDDSLRNLVSAKEAGLFTIQMGVQDCPPGVDASLVSLLDLPSVIPNQKR